MIDADRHRSTHRSIERIDGCDIDDDVADIDIALVTIEGDEWNSRRAPTRRRGIHDDDDDEQQHRSWEREKRERGEERGVSISMARARD